MNAAPETETSSETIEQPVKKPTRRKLLLATVPVAILLVVGGAWLTGVLPGLGGKGRAAEADAQAEKTGAPVYVDVPEMVANLNTGTRKPSYVKITVRIEVPDLSDADKVRTAMPRVQDVIQTYLREMRPDELRGSAGVYRLREELLVRANAAVAPAKIDDILFIQMLIQ
jgi:flagellar FliL protein